MSTRLHVLIALLISAVSWTAQGTQSAIHKCLSNERLHYQHFPCGAEQLSLAHSIRTLPGLVAPPPTRMASPSSDFQSAATSNIGLNDRLRLVPEGELVVGMSDTIVLNHPGWRRPDLITRLRAPEGFREEWSYASSDQDRVRILSFINGRLIAIDVETRPVLAEHTPRRPGPARHPSETRAPQWRNGPTGTALDIPASAQPADAP